ncbi:hypothetical protein OEB99_16515 [Actinotalea sp. M2MS4P-6]|uniref:hypothetical protein n=1 Tax=Actinotalea sp. M2MS4P-6 TaxID=2983762 RepID=UPI0021E50FC8|nr:hypothetical protein [Actinotalea sp. M2MS4P-6]MCV2395920.1 hypothetical protein [Actinotalea sp. M2MS4P-6]
MDRGLAEGLTYYDEHLTANGIPDWLALDATQEWEPDETFDGYAAVVELAEAEYRKDGKERPAGLRIFAVPKPAPQALVRSAVEDDQEVV